MMINEEESEHIADLTANVFGEEVSK